jgi:TPR repeat protein
MSAQEPQDAALGDPATSPLRAISEHQIALWVKRGEEFAAAGDFVSARLVFQRAAETGNANAAFMLAGTYDPTVLDLIRAIGVVPDVAKARLWYEKAKNLGSPDAARRLELLVQQRR